MRNNTEQNRFEIEVEGQIIFADYKLDGEKLYITHVETPTELRGKGTAAKLMQEIADHAASNNLSIIPICGYAAAWMRRQQKNR